MPHKPATQPTRRQDKARRATDLPPKISVEHEPIPKSVSRVLDARRIRQEHRKKKRQLGGVRDSGEDGPHRKIRRRDDADDRGEAETPALRIKPNETVAQFNRRVEDNMMPLIKTALQRSSAQARRVRREEAEQTKFKRDKQTDNNRPPDGSDLADKTANPRGITKEFQISAPRRLNDVAQEPPVIEKLPRGAIKNDATPSGGLSLAQKAMMEEERDKAIRRYRELKARKLRDSGGVTLDA